MINNINVARKAQSGLSDAYIVYEIVVEGGITRYLALFKDAPTTRIGSVRSARHYFIDYAEENDLDISFASPLHRRSCKMLRFRLPEELRADRLPANFHIR